MVRGTALIATLLIGVSATDAASTSPIAEIICDDRQRLEERLSSQFRSEKVGAGMRDPETVMQIWTADNGSWTLVMARANGTSCIVAMGEHWEARPQS